MTFFGVAGPGSLDRWNQLSGGFTPGIVASSRAALDEALPLTNLGLPANCLG